MLLRCESLEPPMSQLGHSRRLSDILVMSASPSTPAVLRTAANRRDCQEETYAPFAVHPQKGRDVSCRQSRRFAAVLSAGKADMTRISLNQRE